VPGIFGDRVRIVIEREGGGVPSAECGVRSSDPPSPSGLWRASCGLNGDPPSTPARRDYGGRAPERGMQNREPVFVRLRELRRGRPGNRPEGLQRRNRESPETGKRSKASRRDPSTALGVTALERQRRTDSTLSQAKAWHPGARRKRIYRNAGGSEGLMEAGGGEVRQPGTRSPETGKQNRDSGNRRPEPGKGKARDPSTPLRSALRQGLC